MTAKELAEELLKNPDDIICVTSGNFEQNGSNKKAAHVFRFEGVVEKQTFRDAFDGETYSSEVVRPYTKKGEEPTNFIKITCL